MIMSNEWGIYSCQEVIFKLVEYPLSHAVLRDTTNVIYSNRKRNNDYPNFGEPDLWQS